MLRLQREQPLEKKVSLAFQMLATAMSMAEANVKKEHPGAPSREIRLRAAALLYGDELIRRAYGWDGGLGR